MNLLLKVLKKFRKLNRNLNYSLGGIFNNSNIEDNIYGTEHYQKKNFPVDIYQNAQSAENSFGMYRSKARSVSQQGTPQISQSGKLEISDNNSAINKYELRKKKLKEKIQLQEEKRIKEQILKEEQEQKELQEAKEKELKERLERQAFMRQSRSIESKQLMELGNKEFKKVAQNVPLFKKIERQYAIEALVPELERKK